MIDSGEGHSERAHDALDGEQAMADLDQAIGDREQAVADREQTAVDNAQTDLQRHPSRVPDVPFETAVEIAHRQVDLDLTQQHRDAHQEQLESAQDGRAVRQQELDRATARIEVPDAIKLLTAEQFAAAADQRRRAASNRAGAARRRADEAAARADAAEDRAKAIEGRVEE